MPFLSGSLNPNHGNHKYPGSTRVCSKCGEEKDKTLFRMDTKDNCLRSWCRKCEHLYDKERKYKRGLQHPMSENKECPQYLGVHVAERALSKFFDHIERMPMNNHGYDFLCGKGFKIDVKSSCVYHIKNKTPFWLFGIKHNVVADYFLCLGFDNRENLEPMRIWLIPAQLINHQSTLTIKVDPLKSKKFSEFEQSLDKVLACCNAMKEGVKVC